MYVLYFIYVMSEKMTVKHTILNRIEMYLLDLNILNFALCNLMILKKEWIL